MTKIEQIEELMAEAVNNYVGLLPRRKANKLKGEDTSALDVNMSYYMGEYSGLRKVFSLVQEDEAKPEAKPELTKNMEIALEAMKVYLKSAGWKQQWWASGSFRFEFWKDPITAKNINVITAFSIEVERLRAKEMDIPKMEAHDIMSQILRGEDKTISEKYHELLFAVENKYDEESRHDTALRYIRERATQYIGETEEGVK